MSEHGEIKPGLAARKWWRSLSDKKFGDRAAMARLRRCESVIDALSIPHALALARALDRCHLDTKGFHGALELATLLAHVKEDDPQHLHLMRAAGWKAFPGEKKETETGTDRPVLSELRFRRLLQTAPEEKLAAFKRLVRILGGKADVADLTDSYLFWGDQVRERWAVEYFAAGIAQTSNRTDTGETV